MYSDMHMYVHIHSIPDILLYLNTLDCTKWFEPSPVCVYKGVSMYICINTYVHMYIYIYIYIYIIHTLDV